jgi:hypothetical protein
MRPWLILAIALAGCQFSENRHAKRTVQAEEVAGRWTLTAYGLKSLQDVGVDAQLLREPHVLDLRANRTCAVRTVFGLPGGPVAYRTYESGCSWRLGDDGHQFLQLEASPPIGSLHLYFAEEDGALILWWYASDPDAWRYLEFAKGSA